MVLVGGGLGVAPVYPQLRAFKEAGNRTTGIIGFRNKDLVFWEEQFGRYCDNLIVCTDDGSYGKPGFVNAALQEVLQNDRPDLVVAIGPLPMMNACVETSRPFGVKTMVSLNAIMVDGTGMCGSCRVTVGSEIKFACVDGPDFDGHQVDFKELMLRQKRFKGEEAAANTDYAHVCNVEKVLFEQGKTNYKKYKDLAPHATKMPERDPLERSRNFKEVNLGYSMADALAEAERCIMCSKAACIEGCPVSIDIPRFIRHLLVRDIDGAQAVINESNLFPSVCGRVCPQESQCEAQCVVGRKLEPWPSAGSSASSATTPGRTRPRRRAFERCLGKVAVVGSGPSGLAVAADLARYGCDVTVYEALHVVGGVLQYGIPSFRLPREIISREIETLKAMGVKFETNKVIGKTFSVLQLTGEMGYDAVFVGVGAGAPAFLGIPGEFAGQVYSANEFLTRVNLMGGDKFPYLDTPVTLGKSVVVIGAGNTAMDCLRVAKRLGIPTVRCVYRRSEAEAPARIEELRHAKEEGIEFFFLHGPVEILTSEDGNVRGMKVQKMVLGEPDEKGRRQPIPQDEFLDLECDTVIYALGTKANPIVTKSTPGLQLNKWGYIVADAATQATSVPGVFAGGDIVTGAATVILAMGAGRRAARAIGAYLAGGKSTWPITQADADAFQPPTAIGATSHPCLQRDSIMSLCPRCQRPLDDEEPYICCAGVELRWRCADCHKVSEGFAFPYGMCPFCKGKLELLDRGAIEDDQAHGSRAQGLRDRTRRPCLLRARIEGGQGPRAAGAVRALCRHGEGAHGHPVQALPRRIADSGRGLPARPRGHLRRCRPQARGPGQPVPHRHRLRAAGGGLLHRRGRARPGRIGRERAVQGTGRRGARARRPADHRIPPLGDRQGRHPVAPPAHTHPPAAPQRRLIAHHRPREHHDRTLACAGWQRSRRTHRPPHQ